MPSTSKARKPLVGLGIICFLLGAWATAASAATCNPYTNLDAAAGDAWTVAQSDPTLYGALDSIVGQCAANGATNTVGCKQQIVQATLNQGYVWDCSGKWLTVSAETPSTTAPPPMQQVTQVPPVTSSTLTQPESHPPAAVTTTPVPRTTTTVPSTTTS
jgi:hypothetical protein